MIEKLGFRAVIYLTVLLAGAISGYLQYTSGDYPVILMSLPFQIATIRLMFWYIDGKELKEQIRKLEAT